jgi:hypothetical protein
MAQIDLKNATVIIRDGTAVTPNEIEVKLGEGNLTYSEKRNMEYTLDRGILDEVREGDQVPVDVSFDAVWEYIKGTTGTAGVPTIQDALKKINAASGWTSSDADTCRPYVLYDPPCTGDVEEIVLSDFRYESLDQDLRAGTISCSGKCNVTQASVTRGSQTA